MSAITIVSVVNEAQIACFLQAARETIGKIQYCWLATHAEGGGANARAVRVHAGVAGGDEWTRRFVVRRASRKVGELRLDPRVTLAYQDSSGDAYVALGGRACLIEDRTQMRELWPAAVDAAYPVGYEDANMIVVTVEVDRIEIHVRGVTREPFGHGRTLIERETTGEWRFVPD